MLPILSQFLIIVIIIGIKNKKQNMQIGGKYIPLSAKILQKGKRRI